MKKLLSLLVALLLVVGLVACKGGDETTTAKSGDDVTTTASGSGDTDDFDLEAYVAESTAIYNEVYADFKAAYALAKAENVDLGKRFALMAVAEAKLIESGTLLPLSSNGGNYAISRVVPYSITPALWGNDSYRYHQALIVNEQPLTEAQRNELKAIYAEVKGTGAYEERAKAWLADNGFTLNDTYTLGYSSDPQTWDVLATSRAADSEAIVNTYDGLYEYDVENQLKPALAADLPVVSQDGKTVTITLKSGLEWVDQDGNKVADVKADDFVAGMQHMCDVAGGLEYLIQGIIVNATEYIEGDVTDFAQVGVKAINDTTLEYTLVEPCSFFDTMFGYGVFAPLSRAYYTSQGGKFGAEFDAKAEDYTYGKTPANIAYCGPYLVKQNTAETKITFEANPKYWNKDNINITEIVWEFNDGTDPLKAYNGMKEGHYAGAGLSATSLAQSKADLVEGTDKSWFETYHYTSGTDATSFMGFFNINRSQYANVNDPSKASSDKNDSEKAVSKAAMGLQDFRLALCYALDREAYNAQAVGEELALTSLINSYTPGTFVSLPNETTITVGGEEKTYPAGTFYGKIMQDVITADGYAFKVWDQDADGGIGASSGFDGWFNEEAAVAAYNKAVDALVAAGTLTFKTDKDSGEVTVTAKGAKNITTPIYIDLPCFSGSTTYLNRANAFAQSVKNVLGGNVVINLVTCSTSSAWYYAGYYTDFGYQANYDIYDVSGWGPDYGDPQTYLDTFLPDFAGYMVKCVGIF
ncbi:peptide ABC transporter substrate-binding protein [bacterium]|nr:peptide ABC transporter substrate-binding protein [bacterium]